MKWQLKETTPVAVLLSRLVDGLRVLTSDTNQFNNHCDGFLTWNISIESLFFIVHPTWLVISDEPWGVDHFVPTKLRVKEFLDWLAAQRYHLVDFETDEVTTDIHVLTDQGTSVVLQIHHTPLSFAPADAAVYDEAEDPGFWVHPAVLGSTPISKVQEAVEKWLGEKQTDSRTRPRESRRIMLDDA